MDETFTVIPGVEPDFVRLQIPPDGPYSAVAEFSGNATVDIQSVDVFGRTNEILIEVLEGMTNLTSEGTCRLLLDEDTFIRSFSFDYHGGLAIVWEPETLNVDDLSGVLTVKWTLLTPVSVVDSLVRSMRHQLKLMSDMLDEVDHRPGHAGSIRAYQEANGEERKTHPYGVSPFL